MEKRLEDPGEALMRKALHELTSQLAAIRLGVWALGSRPAIARAEASIVRRIEKTLDEAVATIGSMRRLRFPGPAGKASPR